MNIKENLDRKIIDLELERLELLCKTEDVDFKVVKPYFLGYREVNPVTAYVETINYIGIRAKMNQTIEEMNK
ncbi:MAG: hypothetical protein WD512_05790 [Candidatus Paceibacterota bacterium]